MNPPKIHTFGKKQKPEGDLRTRLRKHIMSGGAPKEFAAEQGWHSTTAGKMLDGMGIRKVYITDEEHAFLIKMRKNGVESLTIRAEHAEAELAKYLLACPASPTEEERRRCQQWWSKSGKSP